MAETQTVQDAPRSDRPGQLVVPAGEAYRAWVGRLADHMRLSKAATIDQALAGLARAQGFVEKPPRR